MKSFAVLAFFFALIAVVLAKDCSQAVSATCSKDYQVTKDCCAATQGAPISFSELSHECANIFDHGINFDKFNSCCKSRGKVGQC